MERRSFLLGLLALSAGSTTAAIAGKAEAGALPKGEALTLPDGAPIEYAQFRRGRWRTVCTWRRNRWGRRVRVCRRIRY